MMPKLAVVLLVIWPVVRVGFDGLKSREEWGFDWTEDDEHDLRIDLIAEFVRAASLLGLLHVGGFL